MRTIDYSEVLRGTAALAGGLLLADAVADATAFALLRTAHNRRLRIAWEAHCWPDLCPIEQRSFRPPWNAATTYAAGAEVLDIPTLSYFQALQASTGQAPTTAGVTNDAYWAVSQTSYQADAYDATQTYAVGDQVLNLADNQVYQMYATGVVVSGESGALTSSNGRYVYDPAQNLWVGPANTTISPPDNPAPTTSGVYALVIAVGTGGQTIIATSATLINALWSDAATSTVIYGPGQNPGLDGWGLLTPFQRYVAYDQTDVNGNALTPIGELFTATDKDPRITTKVCRLPFTLTQAGFAFTQLHHNFAFVWLKYRLQRPLLTGDVFDATQVYTSGRQVYYADPVTAVGNFYTCTATTTAGQSPATTPGKWTLVALPYLFAEYLVQGGYADWLTQDGQTDKAAAVEGMCEQLLEMEADKLQRQQGQVNRLNFKS